MRLSCCSNKRNKNKNSPTHCANNCRNLNRQSISSNESLIRPQRETRTKPARLVATNCVDIRIRLHAVLTVLGCTPPNTRPKTELFSTEFIDEWHFSWQIDRRTRLTSSQCRTKLGCTLLNKTVRHQHLP